MSARNRQHLKQEFSDGERPSGTDFADLMDSFLNLTEDGLQVDTGNLVLSQGLGLGGSSRAVAGTLRFSGGRVQFHDGVAFVDLASGGSGAFQPMGGAGAVVHAGGNVGIGTSFTPATPPAFRLDVDLGANASEADRARFGNAAVHNGSAGFASTANFSHRLFASNTGFALRQTTTGEVQLNAPPNQAISLRQNGNNVRLLVTPAGNVAVGPEIPASTAALQVTGNVQIGTAPANGNLLISGEASKPGGGVWVNSSDARLKEDVRDFELGLAQLVQVRPVRYRYNGKAGTPAGFAGVGIIGQEMEQVFPEMVRRIPGRLDGESESADLRVYDGSALTYVLVNAVKELAARVESLEQPSGRQDHGRDG